MTPPPPPAPHPRAKRHSQLPSLANVPLLSRVFSPAHPLSAQTDLWAAGVAHSRPPSGRRRPVYQQRASSPCPRPCAAPDLGPRHRDERPRHLHPRLRKCPCTSPPRTRLGSAAPARTPTASSATTSPRARTVRPYPGRARRHCRQAQHPPEKDPRLPNPRRSPQRPPRRNNHLTPALACLSDSSALLRMSRAGLPVIVVVLPVAEENPRESGGDLPPWENLPRSCRGGAPRRVTWRRTAPWNTARR